MGYKWKITDGRRYDTTMAEQEIYDKILHITDLHFWKIVYNPFQLLNKRFLGNINVILRRRREFMMHRAEEFSHAAAATGVKTVLIGGDLTSTATEAELSMGAAFVRGLADRGMKVYVIPGNHDIYTYGIEKQKRFEAHFGEWMPESFPARVILPGGTPLVMVPTVGPNRISSKGRITPEQLAATRQLVEGCPPGPIIVAGHYPYLYKTYAYSEAKGRRLRNASGLRRALGDTGRQILYAAGHVHRFSYVQDPQYDNLKHLTTVAFFHQRRGAMEAGGFTELQVHIDGFNVLSYVHANKWRRELVVPKVGDEAGV